MTVKKTTTEKTTAKKTAPAKSPAAKKAPAAKPASTAKTAIALFAPHDAVEVAVIGALKPRVAVHWPRFTVEDGRSIALAACSGKRGKSYSYGFAKTFGVTLCRKCFGSQP